MDAEKSVLGLHSAIGIYLRGEKTRPVL